MLIGEVLLNLSNSAYTHDAAVLLVGTNVTVEFV